MAERIILRTGEALVAGGPTGTAAEPEVVIGALDGPVGTAMATLMGSQVKGHTRVFALLNTDVQVRPATLMVSKVTVGGTKVTAAGVKKLAAALPNCKIIWDGRVIEPTVQPPKEVNSISMGSHPLRAQHFRVRVVPESRVVP